MHPLKLRVTFSGSILSSGQRRCESREDGKDESGPEQGCQKAIATEIVSAEPLSIASNASRQISFRVGIAAS
jgi:hypothetical protein